jgi:hypothetical protein
MQVRLHIETSDSATLQLGQKPAEKITEMHLEGLGFTGASTGVIESPDAIRTGAKKLNLKLIPHEGMLVGQDSRNRLQNSNAALCSQFESSARLKRDSSSFSITR